MIQPTSTLYSIHSGLWIILAGPLWSLTLIFYHPLDSHRPSLQGLELHLLRWSKNSQDHLVKTEGLLVDFTRLDNNGLQGTRWKWRLVSVPVPVLVLVVVATKHIPDGGSWYLSGDSALPHTSHHHCLPFSPLHSKEKQTNKHMERIAGSWRVLVASSSNQSNSIRETLSIHCRRPHGGINRKTSPSSPSPLLSFPALFLVQQT